MTGSNRVIRGGSWNNNANNCRSAQRNNNNPDNRNNNIGFRLASSPHRPTAHVHGPAPSAPVVTRAAIPRPATGTNSTAAPASHRAGRGGPFARYAALALAALLAAAAPHAARADTAYSNLFTIDLRSGPIEPVLQALDGIEAAAIARVDADRDALAEGLAYLFLVMDGKHGADALKSFVSYSKMSTTAFNAFGKTIFADSKAGGASADLAGGLIAHLAVNWAVGRAEDAQAEYFRATLKVLDGLWGTKDLATVRAAIAARLDNDFHWGSATLGFGVAKQRIHSRVAALKTLLTTNPPGASFPGNELATLIGLSAQGLRDSTGKEAPLTFFDNASSTYSMTLQGSAAKYAATAQRLFQSDKQEQTTKYWVAVGLGTTALVKGVVAILLAPPSGGASLPAWFVAEKALFGAAAVVATVAYEGANLENNRLAALYAFDALDTELAELSVLDDTFTFRRADAKVLLPTIDALVRTYAGGQGHPLDGFSLTVEQFTIPSMVYTAANGIGDAEGELHVLNSGTRPATPAPLLVVSSWNREGYEKVAVGSVEGLRTLAAGERATFTWRSSAVAFSVVPSNVDLTLGFGPQLVRVGYGAADVNQFLVVPPDMGSVGGNISVVPVGAGTSSGSTVSFNHQPQATTAYVTFTLAFAFGDLDLHVYDGRGGHRGVNYTTGKVETSIPGEGPDPRGNPESIRVPATPGVTYRVEVVDRTNTPSPGPLGMLRAFTIGSGTLAATADNTYRVTAIEEKSIGPILEVSPRELQIVVKAAASDAIGTISLREIGLQAGVSSLAVSVGALTGAAGETIPASEMTIELESASLQPGENTTVTVRVPLVGRSAFPYAGEVTVTSSAGTQHVALTIAREASRIRRRLRP